MGLACLLVLLETGLVLRNLFHLPTLGRVPAPAPEEWPSVSVIMPVRDEAANVAASVESRMADDYPDLQVILIDDRSIDDTGSVAQRAASDDPRFMHIRVDSLPAGWLGKVHALQRGYEAATGDWLLFSDGDAVMETGTLRRAIGYCESQGIDQLALIPSFRSESFLVEAAWAAFLRGLIVMADPAKVRDPASKIALGSGGFNLVRRTAYEATGGFEYLRMETADDVALASIVKEAGGRLAMIDGSHSVRVPLYRSIGALLRGIEKNGSTTAQMPFPVLVLALVALGAVLGAPAAALVAGPGWLHILGGITLAAYTGSEMFALWRNTRRWMPAVIWPIGYLVMAYGIVRATRLAHRNGGVSWRDTFYSLEELETGRRFTL